jgi:hypothetical protein
VFLEWVAPPVDATYETLSGYVIQSNASGSWQTVKTLLRPPPTFLQPSPFLQRNLWLGNQAAGTSYRVAGIGSVSGQGAFVETIPVTFDQPPFAMLPPSVSRDNFDSYWATIAWDRPEYDGGLPLQGYILQIAYVAQFQYYDYQYTWTPMQVGTFSNGRVPASTLSVSNVPIPTGTGTYAIRVVAVNSAGECASPSSKITNKLIQGTL